MWLKAMRVNLRVKCTSGIFRTVSKLATNRVRMNLVWQCVGMDG